MKHSDFNNWLNTLNKLSRGQRNLLLNLLQQPESKNQIIKIVELNSPPDCCACGEAHPYRWGQQAGLQRYRCRSCGHTYTKLSSTPLARLRLKERWLLYSQALIEGLSIRKAAKQCHISKTTSFRWRHRFLELPNHSKPQELTGIVEADETFFAKSFKGQRELPRLAHKRGRMTHKAGTGKEQVPVLVIRDRQGLTTDFKLTVANTVSIEPLLKLTLARDAVLCSDGAAAYRVAAQHLGLTHHAVNLMKKIRVISGAYHIQNVNAYDSRLKEWMRRFHGVATKYLENYLGWRRFIERWGESLTPEIALTVALARENPFQLLTRT
jgi:transposase-like protein